MEGRDHYELASDRDPFQIIHECYPVFCIHFLECGLWVPFQSHVCKFFLLIDCMIFLLAPNVIRILVGMTKMKNLFRFDMGLTNFFTHYKISRSSDGPFSWYCIKRLGSHPLFKYIPNMGGNWHLSLICVTLGWFLRDRNDKIS